MILSSKQITKALIRLSGCAGWSATLLFVTTPNKTDFLAMRPICAKLFQNRSVDSDKKILQVFLLVIMATQILQKYL